ncbi:transcriptional regulator [Lactobacillus delbrueckii]|uniref:Transcriptional regulator n=1 Tax=Lactobacillus delbrueckii TaxID=1584 RepID=A0ABD0AFP8_9LACO|nr:helix-turn-helix transcriptional regulator [Lactobacillus delbrueckii]GHN18504.1 transcriptional regulator [Lactobacillus delbrueckii]GHN33855.1 transcriptional regulator [Lactobacillus delbrueckii]GHN41531.1 transcriptional regulator [Lactobacillus delbrueckii]
MTDAVLSADKHLFSLKKFDIIVATGFKEVHLSPLAENSKAAASASFRLLQIDLACPDPLNQYLVADNALIHDLMNDKSGKYAYIVFQNLTDGMTKGYINLLEILAKRDKDEYNDFQVQRLAGLLLTELLHQHWQKISKSRSNFPRKNVRHANRDTQSGAIMTYLTQKNGQVSLKEAAEYFGYEANYFSRLCRKLFATDFVHLRRNIRINLAEDQLLLTNKKLEEIADELGYQDLSSFSKAFAESTGLSPGKYWKKYTLNQINT